MANTIHIGTIQNGLKGIVRLKEGVITSETTSAVAAGKVETCRYTLQVPNIAIQTYPALQLTQAKHCQLIFGDETL